jgi:RNA polymerase sporulation-specific sigma factor
VKVSRTLKELSLRATREREAFFRNQGREPSITELAQLLGVEREQAVEAVGASMPALSLTRTGDEDDGADVDIPVPPPEEQITDRLALRQVLLELPEHDRCLIVLRYLKRQTQQATADQLGMTQVQVSRRERTILQEMRRRLTG